MTGRPVTASPRLSIRALAKALSERLGRSISHPYVIKLQREPWAPQPPLDRDVDAWAAAIERHVRAADRPADRPPPASTPSAPSSGERVVGGPPEELLAPLRARGAKTVDVIDAAVRLAAWRIAEGAGSSRAMDDLKKLHAELRQAEAAATAAALREGELVTAADVRAEGARIGEQVVRALESLRILFAERVEEWLGDDAFHELSPPERARAVSAWVDDQVRAVRGALAR